MNDFYTEQLVKKRTDIKDTFVKALLVALTIVSVLIAFMYPIGLLFPLIMLIADFIIFRRLDVEYEYLYLNGDLDIDKIMHKEKRKRVFSTNVSDMDLLAPTGASELRQYSNARVLNYATGNPEAQTYEMIVTEQGNKTRLIFEPNATIVEGIWTLAPRKVIKNIK